MTLLAMATMAPVVTAQTRPATGPAPTLADLQAAERKSTLNQLANLRELSPAAAVDVVQLGRDGDHLCVQSRLPPTAGQCRITVTDLGGLCTVNDVAARRRGDAPPAAGQMPFAFLFDWYQFDRPGTTVACTTVEVLPATVQLSRTTEAPGGGGTQVQLIEQRLSGGLHRGGDPGVSLKVSDQGDGGRPPLPDVGWTADSFADLCRLHPTEVARHLEPILRDLHADLATLPADRPLAYQVFTAEAGVDAATAGRVQQLVAQLDADDFHDRDGAEAQLRAMGPVAAVAVGRIDVATLSPEQRARTAAVVRHFRPVTGADAARLGDNVDFLLNCLRDDDPFVIRAALGRLRTVVGHEVVFDTAAKGQARWDAIWRLRWAITRPAATAPAAAVPG